MPEKKDLYQQLLNKGFSKKDIHSAIHKFILQELHYNKQVIPQKKNHPNPVTRCFNTPAIHQLKGKALCLLKTLFAKKPKNPI